MDGDANGFLIAVGPKTHGGRLGRDRRNLGGWALGSEGPTTQPVGSCIEVCTLHVGTDDCIIV